ncbi:MAG TPA: alpha/beta hydrolase-fold protein [Vicinamibacterales bacterium]|nr:alpha/beta hydrolase-fold protein [Vicinamibacterales bacterium]
MAVRLPSTASRLIFGLVAAVLAAGVGVVQAQQADHAGLRFEISFPASAHDGPITGRVYVMISRTDAREPRLQIGRTGVPFFGRDVVGLRPGQAATIDASDLGSPIESLRDLPPGDYYVQGFVNVYSEFRRADGHVVWMHDDQWEGQRWNQSPGNLKSAVERVRLDPASDEVVRLTAGEVLPPVEIPPDTAWVKRFRFQSPMLTKFWGRPIYLGATVLLPRDYDRETISYPVNYIQGHFSLNAPNGFNGTNAFSEAWMSDGFPRMILVTFQHPNPYFDDSYAVNSVNVGPYGDAIMQELIPEIERRFRVIREPYARILSGGSTGGWEALALQIFHPDFFGGTWAYCPDPVTFTDVEGINIYEDENAFYKQYEWRREPTINSRETDGRVRLTSEQRNRWELVNGTRGRSGEQLDIWSAVYGPLGADGYFEPLFDKRTGVINPEVAAYWRDHYDLVEHLKRNWTTVGPKLVDKLHVYTGTMDTYYLNNSTAELEAWMKTTENPHYEGFFLYGDRKPHCWSGPATPAERLKEMATFVMSKAPDGTLAPWWRY